MNEHIIQMIVFVIENQTNEYLFSKGYLRGLSFWFLAVAAINSTVGNDGQRKR